MVMSGIGEGTPQYLICASQIVGVEGFSLVAGELEDERLRSVTFLTPYPDTDVRGGKEDLVDFKAQSNSHSCTAFTR